MSAASLKTEEDPKVKVQRTVMSPAEPWTVELAETVIEHPRGEQDVTVDQGDG